MAAKNRKREKPSSQKHIRDEQTHKRIHEHLVNEDDVISHEDISNAKTFEITDDRLPEKDTGAPLEDETREANEDEKKLKDNLGPDINTSWNVLES